MLLIKILFSLFFVVLALIFILGRSNLAPGLTDSEVKNIASLNKESLVVREITVLNVNLAFFYGAGNLDMSKEDWSKERMLENIDIFSEQVNQLGVDILMLQEVDHYAQRSFYMNQIDLIAQRTELKNSVPLVSWDIPYVPYPYFPVSRQFGRTKSGGGILSRFPIKACKGYLLPKPSENFWWYNRFYLFRYYQSCQIHLGDQEELNIYNLHLEAFKAKNRSLHVELLKEGILKDSPDIIGGDFNFVPPFAKKFDEAKKENYFETNDYNDLLKDLSKEYQDTVSIDDYKQGDISHLTFPRKQPNRKLDYQFYMKSRLELISSKVVDLGVSDHRGLLSKYKLLVRNEK